jgi:hypothetical protein
MDINHPQWPQYEAQFETVAGQATPWADPVRPSLVDATAYLCLYGDNGLTPEAEFALLQQLADLRPLYCITVETVYWQEQILYVP